MVQYRYVLSFLVVIELSHGYPRISVTENPEETAGYFEGDIDLNAEQITDLRSRNGLIARDMRWPNRLVIYKISPAFDHGHRAHIEKAIRIIEDETCVRFQEADDSDEYYINITANPSGCHSAVGYQKSAQSMNLQIFPLNEGCFRLGSILHEFLHGLGFYHQQSASDRDDFITVLTENIEHGMEHNFAKQTKTENFGISYDYKSVLHYSSVAFSKNGEKTILAHDPQAVIGQRTGLSDKDIQKINTMYLCPIQI